MDKQFKLAAGLTDADFVEMPTVYFLDICAIAHIKTYLPSKSVKDEHHKESIRALHDLDLPQNSVSYLSALMEKASDQRSKFSAEEFVLEARRDWDAMGAFFKNARVFEPWDFVEAYATELFGAHPEQSAPEYLAYASGHPILTAVGLRG